MTNSSSCFCRWRVILLMQRNAKTRLVSSALLHSPINFYKTKPEEKIQETFNNSVGAQISSRKKNTLKFRSLFMQIGLLKREPVRTAQLVEHLHIMGSHPAQSAEFLQICDGMALQSPLGKDFTALLKACSVRTSTQGRSRANLQAVQYTVS